MISRGPRYDSAVFSAGVVESIDLDRDPADDGFRTEIRQLLAERGVVCIRFARPLSDDELQRVASMFGTIKELLGGGSLGGDDLRPGLFEQFHTDDSYTEYPAAVTVLHARALPESGGGATSFLDMRAAYQLLDEPTQARLVGLHAVHAYNNHDAFPPRASATGPLEELVDVSHPVVRAHPIVNTSALYFDLDRATHIESLPIDEGRALLQSLQDHAEANAPRYAHAWHDHDVLVWDNASVQHKAGGDFRVGEERRFWRYMIEGEKPVAAGAPTT
jgi:alpha-ketoglutarate-dependent taurine dioxygenase